MKTVQVAIHDAECSQTICNLLRREGRHAVVAVNQPDLLMDGIIVLDCEHLEHIGTEETLSDRFVLVTRKDPDKLAWIWNAGIRHVVFEDDSPTTVQLAVSAAELRQSRPGALREPREQDGSAGSVPAGHRHTCPRSKSELTALAENGQPHCRACHHRSGFSFTDSTNFDGGHLCSRY